MKKIFVILFSLVSIFVLGGCNTKVDNSKKIIVYDYKRQDVYYQGDIFKLRVEDYFDNVNSSTKYTTDKGEISEEYILSALLDKSGEFIINVTAKNSEENKAVLKIVLNVTESKPVTNLFDDFKTKNGQEYGARSAELLNLVADKYWNSGASVAMHYYPNMDDVKGDNSTAYVWPYTEFVASVWRLVSQEKGSEKINNLYKEVLDGFEYYRSFRTSDGYHSYAASRANEKGGGAGDHYYDDNIWISRELLNAYEVLGDDKYLEDSISTAEYVYSGWADDELGGIYWAESGSAAKKSRNACSNAPASILFSRLYLKTKDIKWLNRAKSTYEFTYNNLRDGNGVYWDNVSNSGNIDYAQYTYNTGSMITAGVKLYEITKDINYLNQAKQSCDGAFKRFFENKDGFEYKVINQHNSWFNVLMLDGFIEVYSYDSSVYEYIETYEKNLNNAYDNYRSPDGFVSYNWVNGFNKNTDGTQNYYKLNILEMAANSENYGQLAHFYEKIKGV